MNEKANSQTNEGLDYWLYYIFHWRKIVVDIVPKVKAVEQWGDYIAE